MRLVQFLDRSGARRVAASDDGKALRVLTGVDRRYLAADGGEPLALEADRDDLVRARVLVDRCVLGEAELCDEEVVLVHKRS